MGFWSWKNATCQGDDCHPCHGADPAVDTVKVAHVLKKQKPRQTPRAPAADKENDPTCVEEPAGKRTREVDVRAEAAEAEARCKIQRLPRERRLQAEPRRLEGEEARLAALAAAEEERRQEAEAEAQAEAEAAAAAAREAAHWAELRREEDERRAKEAAHWAELRREEDERRAKEAARLEQEAADLEVLRQFLEVHGFKAKGAQDGLQVNAAKRTGVFRGTTYPLHVAVKLGDAKVLSLLLDAGADAEQKDSSGKTPMERAVQLNKSCKEPGPPGPVLEEFWRRRKAAIACRDSALPGS